ncbi:MAG: hypothetical protein D6722_05010, partial [Bacteroidetes bacterium]
MDQVHFAAQQLLKALQLSPKQPQTGRSPQALAQQALDWLTHNGYFFARIDTAERRLRPQPHIFLRVRTGQAFRLNQVLVQQ